MPGIARKLTPLHKAVGGVKTKNGKIEWDDDCQTAFDEAKTALADITLLQHPSPTAEMTLTVDASDVAMGGPSRTESEWQVRTNSFFFEKVNSSGKEVLSF